MLKFQKYFWVLVVFFASFVSVYHFQTNPGFWFDEGIISQVARNLALNGVYGIQTSPGFFYSNNFWVTTGYPVVFPVSFFINFFGVSIWVARIAPFAYLILFILVSYVFLKKLYGFYPAILGIMLISTFPPFYGNGKAVLGEIPGLFWFMFGCFLYVLYKEKQQNSLFYASALAWGVSIATKPYFVLIIPGIMFLFLYSYFKDKIPHLRQFVIFSAVFSLPIFIWFFWAFDWNSSQNLSATFSYFLNSYGVSSFEPLENLFRFVSESTPIHFAILALVVFVSYFISFKKRNKIPEIISVILIFVFLTFLWYLKTPGWYRYFFPAHIMVLLLFPQAIGSIINRMASHIVVITLILFQAGFLYVNYDNFFGNDAILLQKYIAENISDSASIFIDSLPEVGFVLNRGNTYQYIFINEKFSIGEKQGNLDTDYLITNSIKDYVEKYILMKEIGHYKIYKYKEDVIN